MNKEQKFLILSLLSEAYTRSKEELNTLQKHDDNPLAESGYLTRMQFIEETYKEVERLW
jgi:hypothetical protein